MIERLSLNKQQHKITLFLPGLKKIIESNPDIKMENLETFFSRCDIEKTHSSIGFYQQAASVLGLSVNENSFPQAAIELWGDEQAEAKRWVCFASPVSLMPNRDHLSMCQADQFDLTQDEMSSLCAELNAHFQEHGLHFIVTNYDHLCCYADKPFEIATTAPLDVLGENIFPHIPQGEGKMNWQKIFNEAQMFLHHSQTMQTRSANGKPAINSLWFWGGGVQPEAYQAAVVYVVTDNSCIKNMANLGGASVTSFSGENLSQLSTADGSTLIYLDCSGMELDSVQKLDELLFLSFIQLLNRKKVEEVCFTFELDHRVILTRKLLRRFWKRRKSLGQFFEMLVENN